MSDYINYMDFNAITLAKLANEIGDYKVALEFYRKAFNRLSNYQGDSMCAIMMGGDLNNNIRKIENIIHESKSILQYNSWQLSKSSFVKCSRTSVLRPQIINLKPCLAKFSAIAFPIPEVAPVINAVFI